MIRLANINDIESIKLFLDKYWVKNHAFVKSDELLRWQHQDNDNLNFIISIDEESDEIDALVGFLSTAQFDDNLFDNKDYWGVIWKIKPGSRNGLPVFEFMQNLIDAKSYAAIGMSEDAKKIYRFWKSHKECILNQYFIINPNLDSFELIKVKQESTKKIDLDSNIRLGYLSSLQNIKLGHYYHPKKSIEYLINRYQKHPIYNYNFLGLYDDEELLTIFILRECDFKGNKCLRIIDIYGEIYDSYNLKELFEQILVINNYEYIDCMNYGLAEDTFEKIGFRKVDVENDIVPNYFEPFVFQTIKITSSYRTNTKNNYTIFKGDSDQDRPNKL